MKKGILFIGTVLLSVSFFPGLKAQLMKTPEISSDNRATFHVYAPGAHEVKLINLGDSAALGKKEYTMTEDTSGNWTVTTFPCRPGLHYYEVSVDGFHASDPSAQCFFGWGKWTSMIEIPGDEDFYLPKDVPHGEVREHWYHSSTTGTYRKCLVYTPPGYDRERGKRYPVLYLQHGAGESELGWTMQGKVNFIMDNLLAGGKAVPMIIVMDNGYAAKPGSENPERPYGPNNAFEQLVVGELIPMTDSCFRTLSDADHRAIAGLSMGAGQALSIGLAHPGLFHWIGAFSGAGRRFDPKTSYNGAFSDAGKFNRTYKLLWIGCGYLDGGFDTVKSFHEALDRNGIHNTWYEGPGSHEWQVWRHHIRAFGQLVFQ